MVMEIEITESRIYETASDQPEEINNNDSSNQCPVMAVQVKGHVTNNDSGNQSSDREIQVTKSDNSTNKHLNEDKYHLDNDSCNELTVIEGVLIGDEIDKTLPDNQEEITDSDSGNECSDVETQVTGNDNNNKSSDEDEDPANINNCNKMMDIEAEITEDEIYEPTSDNQEYITSNNNGNQCYNMESTITKIDHNNNKPSVEDNDKSSNDNCDDMTTIEAGITEDQIHETASDNQKEITNSGNGNQYSDTETNVIKSDSNNKSFDENHSYKHNSNQFTVIEAEVAENELYEPPPENKEEITNNDCDVQRSGMQTKVIEDNNSNKCLDNVKDQTSNDNCNELTDIDAEVTEKEIFESPRDNQEQTTNSDSGNKSSDMEIQVIENDGNAKCADEDKYHVNNDHSEELTDIETKITENEICEVHTGNQEEGTDTDRGNQYSDIDTQITDGNNSKRLDKNTDHLNNNICQEVSYTEALIIGKVIHETPSDTEEEIIRNDSGNKCSHIDTEIQENNNVSEYHLSNNNSLYVLLYIESDIIEDEARSISSDIESDDIDMEQEFAQNGNGSCDVQEKIMNYNNYKEISNMKPEINDNYKYSPNIHQNIHQNDDCEQFIGTPSEIVVNKKCNDISDTQPVLLTYTSSVTDEPVKQDTETNGNCKNLPHFETCITNKSEEAQPRVMKAEMMTYDDFSKLQYTPPTSLANNERHDKLSEGRQEITPITEDYETIGSYSDNNRRNTEPEFTNIDNDTNLPEIQIAEILTYDNFKDATTTLDLEPNIIDLLNTTYNIRSRMCFDNVNYLTGAATYATTKISDVKKNPSEINHVDKFSKPSNELINTLDCVAVRTSTRLSDTESVTNTSNIPIDGDTDVSTSEGGIDMQSKDIIVKLNEFKSNDARHVSNFEKNKPGLTIPNCDVINAAIGYEMEFDESTSPSPIATDGVIFWCENYKGSSTDSEGFSGESTSLGETWDARNDAKEDVVDGNKWIEMRKISRETDEMSADDDTSYATTSRKTSSTGVKERCSFM